jgi:hypothetical protein
MREWTFPETNLDFIQHLDDTYKIQQIVHTGEWAIPCQRDRGELYQYSASLMAFHSKSRPRSLRVLSYLERHGIDPEAARIQEVEVYAGDWCDAIVFPNDLLDDIAEIVTARKRRKGQPRKHLMAVGKSSQFPG